MNSGRFELHTVANVPLVFAGIGWLALLVSAVLWLAGITSSEVPLAAAFLTVQPLTVYVGIRLGIYAIFHEQRLDLRAWGRGPKLSLPYNRIVSYRELPKGKVEIAYLKDLKGDVRENLYSETVWPEDTLGFVQELNKRLERRDQLRQSDTSGAESFV